MDAARYVFRHERGLIGLYKGLTITMIREIPGDMAMFGVYAAFRNYFAKTKVNYSMSRVKLRAIRELTTWTIWTCCRRPQQEDSEERRFGCFATPLTS